MNNNLGFGVMIKMLGGNESSAKTFSDAIGKVISKLEIDEKELIITFADNSKIRLFDDGQSCCESRWMHTDDDLDYFVGSILLSGKIKEGPTEGSEDDPTESEFLVISTSLGEFTIVNYNSHNGYYGGFAIWCERVD